MPGFDFSEEARQTNIQFSAEIARLTSLTSADAQRLFPRKIDKDRLVELMAIVHAATARNEKAAQLEKNIQKLSTSVIRLLEFLA
jgi:hypothetical protein